MARPAHLVAVLGVAAAVRLVWAAEVTSSPLAFLSELPETDMHWYHLWAREIAAGDWLGKDLTLLYTAWQKPIASPEEWARWFGPPRYNPAPLYLYFLAGTYALAGPDPRVAIWLQAALGVGTCALLFAVASRAFGPRAGLCAGLAGALYGPLVFFEGFLLRTTLELCTSLLFLHALLRARERTRHLDFVLAGAAGGFAVLAQPTAGVFWVLAAPWVLLSARTRRAGLAELAALGLGLAIPLAVLAVRNLAVGAPLLAIESRGPFALVFGNMAGGRSPGIGFSIPPGAVDILRGSDYRLLPALSAALRTHDSPLAFVAFLGRKLLAIASAFEVYNNVNYQEAVEQSRLLRVLPAFASAAGLGGVGLLLAHARRLRPAGTDRAARALLGLYLLYGLACAGVSLVLSRYRMPLATGLLLHAGLAVAAGVDAIREGRRRRAAALALGALALGGLVSLDLGVSLPRFRPSEPAGIAQLYQARGRPGDAARVIEEALPRFADQPRVAALLHRQAAGYRSRAGDAPRARAHLEAALALETQAAP